MGAFNSLATAGLNLARTQQAAQRESRDISRDRDREIRAIEQQTEEQRRREEQELRRRLATQRARAGAAGVGGGSSSRAVLRGLTEEAEAAQAARERSAGLRIDELRQRARTSQRRNLLGLIGGTSGSFQSVGRSLGRSRSLLG